MLASNEIKKEKKKKIFYISIHYLKSQFVFLSYINFLDKQAVHQQKSQAAALQKGKRTTKKKKGGELPIRDLFRKGSCESETEAMKLIKFLCLTSMS